MDTPLTLINNNGYGAPELKSAYQGITLRGLIIAITIHVGIIVAYLLVSYINNANAKEIPVNLHERKIWVENDVINTNTEKETEEVKTDVVSKSLKDLTSLEPLPVKNDISDKVKTRTQSELDNVQQMTSRNGDTNSYASSNGTIKIDDKIVDKSIDKTNEIPKKDYKAYEVDVIPVCVNLNQVKSSIIYPQLAKEIGKEGNVTVKVLVDETGNVTQIGSLTGPDVFYDEVKEKSRELKFTTGLKNNSPVKVWITVPFNFKLKN